MAESWFALYKTELIYDRVWPTISRLRTATFDYIEIFSTAAGVTARSAVSAPPATNRSSGRRDPSGLTTVSVKPGQLQMITSSPSPADSTTDGMWARLRAFRSRRSLMNQACESRQTNQTGRSAAGRPPGRRQPDRASGLQAQVDCGPRM